MIRISAARAVVFICAVLAVRAAAVSDAAPAPGARTEMFPGVWVEFPRPGPVDRDDATAIYDPVRDRMIVFGGFHEITALNDVWQVSLTGDSAWVRINPAGSPPAGRSDHTAIYDPVRDRMLVFGGATETGFVSDVWELTLSGTPTWNQVMTSGGPPDPRVQHSALYDPVRDWMIIFGGYGPSVLNEVWALSLSGSPTWARISATGNPTAANPGDPAVYDSFRDRILVIGTNAATVKVSQLSLAGTPTWTPILAGGSMPTARWRETLTYDAAHDRVVMIGGESVYYDDDVWALSLSGFPSWSLVSPAGDLPEFVDRHATIYDSPRDRMVIYTRPTAPSPANVWQLALPGAMAWSPVAAPGTPPLPTEDHSAIYDPVRDRMVMFGGLAAGTETWELSLSGSPTWSHMTPTGGPPGTRRNHTAIYDPVGNRMLVFGGMVYFYSDCYNDVWALTLSGTPAWTQISTGGTPPEVRANHTAIYDSEHERMIVFGGSNGPYLDDVWELSLPLSGTPTWTPITTAGSPPPAREGHSAIYDPVGHRMIVFGGYDGTYLNDTWELSLPLSGTPTWAPITPAGTPPSVRDQHSAIYDPGRQLMVVFAGFTGGANNEVWELSLSGAPAWMDVTPAEIPPFGRYSHTAIYDPPSDRMVVFGGDTQNDLWALSLTGPLRVPGGRPAPAGLAFIAPRPNPAVAGVDFEVELPLGSSATLVAYDITGRSIRTFSMTSQSPGRHSISWDRKDDRGNAAPAGVYLLRLEGSGQSLSRKVVLL